MQLRLIEEDSHKDLHIPSPAREHLTPCGWCDVLYGDVESKKAICPDCAILRASHKIPLKVLHEK